MQRSITVKKIIMLNDYSFLSLILSSSPHPPPHPTPLLRLGERKKKPQPCRTKGKVSARPTNTRQLSSVHELSAMPFNQAPLPPSSLFPCRVPPPPPSPPPLPISSAQKPIRTQRKMHGTLLKGFNSERSGNLALVFLR